MLKYLSGYMKEYEEALNKPLMNKSGDGELVDYVVDCWKSMEVVKAIKFLGYEYNTRESEVDMNKHVYKRRTKLPKKDQYDEKLIENNRVGLLTVHMLITCVEKDPKSGLDKIREKKINKDMLIPLVDEQGYMFLNGRKYYLLFQLVEKSTYTTAVSTVVKSLMPIVIKRVPSIKEDVDGNRYIIPLFRTFVFRRETDIMLFILAQFGIYGALGYLKVNGVCRLIGTLDERQEGTLCFQISSKAFLEVDEVLFKKWKYLQAIVCGILEVLTNRFDLSQEDNREIFIKKLSTQNTIEKGLDTLTSFNRMLDETTKKILRINKYNKGSVYDVIRWGMMEFDALRMKDNMDLENKRLRCYEYIASLLTQEFSIRLNRIINLGNKATMENIVDIFRFPGSLLISKMHASGVLRYDESINDMTFFSKFKYTTKGPHSLKKTIFVIKNCMMT